MNIVITEYHEFGAWVVGYVEGLSERITFNAKVFETPSKYGINNGCISKLEVYCEDNNEKLRFAEYDRSAEWVIPPDTEYELDIVESIINYLD